MCRYANADVMYFISTQNGRGYLIIMLKRQGGCPLGSNCAASYHQAMYCIVSVVTCVTWDRLKVPCVLRLDEQLEE